MRRLIFIIALGFIFGIIGGLYFNMVPFVFMLFIIIISILKLFKVTIKSKLFRIVNIFIQNNIMLLFCISALVSSLYLLKTNNEYEKIYNSFSVGEAIGTIVSDKKETEYKKAYKLKLENFNNKRYTDKYFLLEISKNTKIELKYGDKIKFDAEYTNTDEARNYKGFNYRRYLKSQKVYGKLKAEKIVVLKNNNLSFIEKFSNYVRNSIIKNTNKILPQDTKEIFLGILIGYTDNMQEDIREEFKQSSLTHLLAVSGAHISYIILGLSYLLKEVKISKKVRNILIAMFLIFFMYITSFTASVVRASIMGIIVLLQMLICRKQDIKTTMGTTILLILIDNPYKILDIGLILSYFATIGIITFSNMRIKKEKAEERKVQTKILNYLKEIVLITLFANVFVIPVMAYNFNTISFTFVISNLLAGIVMGPITIGGFILIIISFINIKLAYFIAIPYNLLLEGLKLTAKFVSRLPSSQILVSTPSMIIVIFYYIFLFLITNYFIFKKNYPNRFIVKKVIKFLNNFKKILKRKSKIILISLMIFILSIYVIQKVPKDLKIYFIDVGQGDSTLILTPTNKKVLIDGGGSESGSFDVGESTLVPYLLDRKITKIDYIFISHFDSDHCKGLIYLLNNIKVKNLIISKQYEGTKNFEDITKVANKKNTKINIVKIGDKIKIESNIYFDILWPEEKQISNNPLNNNSIVTRLCYRNFSMLFTGDIEEEAEKAILKKYGNNNNTLKSTILKVAHHGSKTSSTKEFLEAVLPKIALIGVGKNNKFGHPSNITLENLKVIECEIYRTDEDGEITIITDGKKIKVRKKLDFYKKVC